MASFSLSYLSSSSDLLSLVAVQEKLRCRWFDDVTTVRIVWYQQVNLGLEPKFFPLSHILNN